MSYNYVLLIERISLLPIIYTNIVAAIIFWAAYLIWLIPEMVGGSRQNAKTLRKEASVQDRGSQATLLALLWVGIGLNFLFAGLLQGAAITWHRTAIFIIGVVLILSGVALRWYAIQVLGHYFTRDVAVSSDQQVIQSGPYRFIRHPAYSGTLLTMLGIGLATTNWASLIAIIICTLVGHLYRISVEEKALSRTIGQPYVEYMQHTRRLIPFVL